jgi:hypothetical protein
MGVMKVWGKQEKLNRQIHFLYLTMIIKYGYNVNLWGRNVTTSIIKVEFFLKESSV